MTVTRYHNRISGPVLDRIDIHVDVPRVDYDKLASSRLSEPSSNIRGQVEKARRMQHARFHNGRAHHRRPRRLRAHPDGLPGGGDSVSV